MLLIFWGVIPMRVAHCQLGFAAADSHTSLLLKTKQNIKQGKKIKLIK